MLRQFLEEGNRKIINLLFVSLILFLAALIVSKVIDIKEKTQVARSTISVSDTVAVYVKPDLALSNFSVVTEAKTVGEALAQNAEKMNATIKAIKQSGVEEKDLKTTNFNIYPRYEWLDEGNFSGKRVLAGYEATQSLEVKIRNLEKIGEIIQAATAAGANETSDLQFTLENQDEIKSQARAKVIKKAKDKAKELAAQLDVRLGRVVYFDESGATPFYLASQKMTGMSEAPPPAAAPDIQTGENKIEVTVTLTYEIR